MQRNVYLAMNSLNTTCAMTVSPTIYSACAFLTFSTKSCGGWPSEMHNRTFFLSLTLLRVSAYVGSFNIEPEIWQEIYSLIERRSRITESPSIIALYMSIRSNIYKLLSVYAEREG